MIARGVLSTLLAATVLAIAGVMPAVAEDAPRVLVTRGLSNGAADWGLSLGLTLRF
jgi:hypothetical protein